jgi:hypothetical protein
MIDHEELAICRRRGHNADFSLQGGWVQCGFCGMWLREVRTKEESEDRPPDDELNPGVKLRRLYES